MSSADAVHPAVLIALAILMLFVSAAIVLLRRRRAAPTQGRSFSVSAIGQAIRRMPRTRPKMSTVIGVVRKRRWLLASLSLIAIAAATWMSLSRATDLETEVAVVEVLAADDAETAIAPDGAFAVEIDSRQLARQDADARRIQQGLILLAAMGVIALLWITASRFAAAR